MTSLNKKANGILGASFSALIVRTGSTAVWLAVNIVFARALSVDDFGAVFYVISFTMLAAQVVSLGYNVVTLRIGTHLFQQMNLHSIANLLNEARWIVLLTTAVLGSGMLLALLSGLDTPLTDDLAIVSLVILLVGITSVMTIHMEALRATGHIVKALFGSTIMRSLGTLIIASLFLVFGQFSFLTAVLSYLLSLAAGLTLELFWLTKVLKAPGKKPAFRRPRHLGMALSIWPGEISATAIARMTLLMLGLQGNLTVVALFVAAERVAMLGQFLTDAIRLAIGPTIALAEQQGRVEFTRAVQMSSALMFVAGAVGGLGLAAFGWVILALFGPAYMDAFPYVLSLLLAQTSWTVLGPTALVANMIGLGKARSVLATITALVMIGCQLLLIQGGGQWAVIWVFIFATWVMNLGLWVLIYSRTGVKCGLPGLRWGDIFQLINDELAKFWRAKL